MSRALYLARSYKDHGTASETCYIWFRERPGEPVRPLTRAEVEALRDYLHRTRGIELEVTEVTPRFDSDVRDELLDPNTRYHKYELWKEEVDALPFPLVAYWKVVQPVEEVEWDIAPQD